MSYIRVIVDEQNLHITDSPKIAAQGVNENYIVFDFDATWSGFSKVALFYREDDESKVYRSLIANNEAVVPHEVTDREGKVCFGICGVKNDKVYTSEILKYKIVKGLYTSGEESEPPTPGIYEQMLQSIDVMRAQVDNLVQNYNLEYSSKTLWEGELYWAGSSVVPWEDADLTRTLSDNVYDFDFVDIYLTINSSSSGAIGRFLFTLPKVEADLLYPILFSYGSKLSGLESGNHNLNACRFTVKFPTSTTINLYEAAVWLWNGSAANDATINRLGGHGFCITKVAGRKVVANAEVTDIRIGADGTVYQSAGAAVRSQLNDMSDRLDQIGQAGSGLSSTAKTLLIAILRNAFYGSEQASTISALEEALDVGDVVRVTGIALSPTSKAITYGSTTTIVASVFPFNATNKAVIWSSSDDTIATVNNGVVTPQKSGTAIITATTVDGNYTASCTIDITIENLLDTSKSTSGVYINKNDGSTPSSNAWNATDYIWLKPNTTYYSEGCFLENFYAFYNAQKQYVTSPPSDVTIVFESDRNWRAKRKGTITTGSTGYYFRGSYDYDILYTPYIALAPID